MVFEKEVIYFNIIKDGDNVLRGAIGEKILEYLLRGRGFSSIDSLKCLSLNNLLFYYAIEFVKNYEYIVTTYNLLLENFIERIKKNPRYFEVFSNYVITKAKELRKEFGVKDNKFKCNIHYFGLGYCYICNERDTHSRIVWS